METGDVINIASYLAPVISTALCLLLLVIYRFTETNRKTDNKIIYTMMIYYGLTFVCWSIVSSKFYLPEVYVHLYPVFYSAFLLSRVVVYSLIFHLTSTGKKEHFHIFHYMLSILLITIVIVWSCFVPYDVQLKLITSYGESVQEYSKALFLLYLLYMACVLYTFVYTWLGLRRLQRYRKALVQYSANYEQSSMNWLYIIFVVSIVLTPYPLFILYFIHYEIMIAVVSLLWRALAIMLQITLCYNLLNGNYTVIDSPTLQEEESKTESMPDRLAFERYIRKQKPYLSPDLKITDLLLPFHTNRHYMSEFINKEYGMNFNKYINTLRLQEMEKMRGNSKYDTLSDVELALAAGFSSYRSYQYLKMKQNGTK